MTSGLSDQSQFTLHIQRTCEFLRGFCANMAEDASRKVCEVFGFESVNKHQEEALRFVIESKSDVFVNLPTGFGKSVVFQVLPVIHSYVEVTHEKNIVIVVSPLVNLTKDQVSSLTSCEIRKISVSHISSND